ncbi:MAG: hypothetical protein ACJAYU_001834, partial [Bradymonadia bacterium]
MDPDGADAPSDTDEDPSADITGDTDTDAADDSCFPTLADYRACETDTDCPIGLGNCITNVPLNRPDPILGDRVAIRDFATDWPVLGVCSSSCATDPTVKPLMMPFAVIVADEFSHCAPKVAFAERYDPVQTLRLRRKNESLGVGIQIWGPCRKFESLSATVLEHL